MAEIITLNPVSVYWACHKNSEVFSGKLTSCVILNSQGYVKKTHTQLPLGFEITFLKYFSKSNEKCD